MKTFASKEKQAVPAIRKTRPYVYHPMGAVQQAQQAEVRRILRSTGAQYKLTIGQPDDKYEQEADRVADQVMRMPDPKLQRQPENEEEEEMLQAKPLADQITPLVQRQEEPSEEEEEPVQAKSMLGRTPDIQRICPECEKETAQRQPMEEEEEELQPGYDQEPEEPTPFMESVPTRDAGELGGEEEELLQAKSDTGDVPQVTSGIARDIQSIKGTGQPLPASERAFFEPRFGIDFSHVRVHNDNRAGHISRSINARAFTLGRDVVFGAGQYSLGAPAGRKLLAHELTHVVQQNGGGYVRQKRVVTPLFVGGDLRDRNDVIRMAPANYWKIIQEIKGKSDELKDALGKDEAFDDLFTELTNPKPSKAEKWADLLIKSWGRRLSQNKKDLLYVGWGAITAYSKLVSKKSVVGLIDKSVAYSRWARNNIRESKRSSKLKLKYRKAYKIVKKIRKGMLLVYVITHDLKYFTQYLRLERLEGKYSRLYRIHRELARVLAKVARIQKNIAKIFDKASDKIDKELSPPSKRSRSGSHIPSIIDAIIGFTKSNF